MKRRNFFNLTALSAALCALSAAVFAQEPANVARERLAAVENAKPLFFVAPNGNDAWSGTRAAPNAAASDGPFRTLERARDAVRETKRNLEPGFGTPLVIEVASGLYELSAPFELSSEDGGDAATVVWRSASLDAPARLVGGRFLSGAKKVDDAKILARLKEDVRGKIVQIDLKALGINDLDDAANGPELFFQGEPTRIARYPNDGFVKITGLSTDGTTPVDIRGTKGIAEGKFQFDDETLLNWADETDVWLHGYWFWDWAEQKQRVASIDAATKTATLEGPNHSYGYRVGQWFYAFNVLAELDAPGEYYVDRENGVLYFYPPTDDWKDGDFLLTQLPNVVRFKNVSNLVFSGFDLSGSRGDALVANGCAKLTLANLDVSNVGGSGIVLNGTDCDVYGCELWNLGRGGIFASGGDRTTLTPGKIRVVENLIRDYARIQRVYQPGVSVGGVGLYVANNLVERAPHMGMGFSGNDHLIEYNEIANVCEESNDAGAVYTGRNWTMRGNVLRRNYLHNIRGFEDGGCMGIYLDDMFSSAEISENLFVDVARAAFIGGGRDSAILDNVFIDCKPAIHVDARALGWCADHADGWIREARKKGTLSGIKFDEPPYSTRYPELAAIFDEGKTPKAPEGNVIRGNVCVGGNWDVNAFGQWKGPTVEEKARPYLTFEKNYVGDDPGFVAPEKGDYRLKDDSPLLKDGFKSLPIQEMGLQTERMKAKAAKAREKIAAAK